MTSLNPPVEARQVLAVASFSAAAVAPGPTVAAISAVAGLSFLFVAVRAPGNARVGVWAGCAGLGVIVVSQLHAALFMPGALPTIRQAWVVLLVVACVALLVYEWIVASSRIPVVAALVAVLVPTLVLVVADWEAPGGFDVYRNHQAAGEALVAAENPYGGAVQIESGNPHVPEGSMITGYSYPPVVLATYGLAATFTDSRIVSLIAWLAVIGWLAYRGARSDGRGRLARSMLVLAATAPLWPLVWYSGWTEPLSLGLLLTSVVLWSKRPVASAVVLGLALASKQYFLFLVPLLLLHRGDQPMKRTSIAVGTAAITMVPALMADASLFLQATVWNLADIGFRPDSLSISGLLADMGLELALPAGIWIVVSLGFAAVVARQSVSPGDFLLYGATILAFAFLVGQAFPNYWFLILGMAAVGSVLKQAEARDSQGGPSPSTAV